MSNTPTLMQSEERRLNELNSELKKIQVEVTVSITMSKTTTIEINEGEENDDNKLLTAFDSQKYSPEQIRAILEEYKHRKSINNFQTKLNDLSGWVVDDKCVNLE